MPTISVIVPIYNVEKYIEDCIESVLAQTYKDFELILIDDGSDDNSYAICKKYVSQDRRIILIHQNNKGQAAARNKGIQFAKGKWICFLDADDVLHPTILEILFNNLINTNSNISMCDLEEEEYISSEFYKEKSKKFRKYEVDEKYLNEIFQKIKYRYWTVTGKLINIKIIKKYPFTEGKIYEDNAVVCKWLYEAKNVVDTNEKLYFYRINYNGTTKSNFSKKRVDYLWALEEQILFYDNIKYKIMLQNLCNFYLENATEIYKKIKDKSLRKDIYIDTRKIYKKYKKQVSYDKEKLVYTFGVFHPKLIKVYWRYLSIKNKFIK